MNFFENYISKSIFSKASLSPANSSSGYSTLTSRIFDETKDYPKDMNQEVDNKFNENIVNDDKNSLNTHPAHKLIRGRTVYRIKRG